jgi:soluble cytochrome b562
MIRHLHSLVVGFVAVALSVGLGTMAASTRADDDEPDIPGTIQKMADAIAKADTAAAQKAAAKLPKGDDLDLGDVMQTMDLRTHKDGKKGKGLGVGPTPGAIRPDGIEAKIDRLANHAPSKGDLNKEAKAIERAADIAAACGTVAKDHPPAKDNDGNPTDAKEWKAWAEQMVKLSRDLAKAARAKDPAQVQAAAGKLNDSCVQCHTKYK